MLFRNLVIKNIVAAVMLVVFAFSIMPTILLHNWFATHTDSVSKTAAGNQEQVAMLVFNCHCDSIVAESPFTGSFYSILIPAFPVYNIPSGEQVLQIPGVETFFHALRGPPVV